jgi:micrococcal nuclease
VPVTVARVVDGDTIHVKYKGKDETVRMLLIDTPEDVDPYKPVEPFGFKAASYAKSVLPVGKHIYMQLGKKGYERDKYHRLLAYIYVTPSDMYNKDVVKKGFARVAYIYKPNTDHLSELQSAQSYAKSKKLGIWSISGYVTSSGYSLAKSCTYAKSNGYSTKGCGTASTTSSKGSTATSSKGLNVKHGQEASVTIKTKAGAKGTIEVDYSSGPSKASGLTPKTADKSGYITWSWRVGTSTKPGKYAVIIRVSGSTIKKTLTVF